MVSASSAAPPSGADWRRGQGSAAARSAPAPPADRRGVREASSRRHPRAAPLGRPRLSPSRQRGPRCLRGDAPPAGRRHALRPLAACCGRCASRGSGFDQRPCILALFGGAEGHFPLRYAVVVGDGVGELNEPLWFTVSGPRVLVGGRSSMTRSGYVVAPSACLIVTVASRSSTVS